MALIRSFVHFIWMALSIIVVAMLMGLGRFFVSEPTRYRIGAWWCKSVIFSLRVICGVKWRVQGIENLPQDPHARIVVLCKHQSAWETFALQWVLQRDIVFVFKKELLKIPFFGWALGSVDMVHIDRSARAEAMQSVIEQGGRLIGMGRWMALFPEGTRVPRGQTIRYKSGGVRTALATNADIVPVALSSGKCWPKGAFVKRPGMIDVVIGPVISSQGKSHQVLTREVQDWIEGQMRIIDAPAYAYEKESVQAG